MLSFIPKSFQKLAYTDFWDMSFQSVEKWLEKLLNVFF